MSDAISTYVYPIYYNIYVSIQGFEKFKLFEVLFNLSATFVIL